LKFTLLISILLWVGLLFFTVNVSFGSIAFIVLAALSVIYVINVFSNRITSPFVRDAAFVSSLVFQSLACIGALLLVAMFVIFGVRWYGLANALVTAIYAVLIVAAPAGLYAIWRTNRNQNEKAASIWKGALIVSLILSPLLIAEHFWLNYQERQLKNGSKTEVIAALDWLGRYPFNARFRIPVCRSLVMRDIADSFSRHNLDTGHYLPDQGHSQIEAALKKRFGLDAIEVIDHVKRASGPDILDDCARWVDPT
jgi:hypothetical protein